MNSNCSGSLTNFSEHRFNSSEISSNSIVKLVILSNKEKYSGEKDAIFCKDTLISFKLCNTPICSSFAITKDLSIDSFIISTLFNFSKSASRDSCSPDFNWANNNSSNKKVLYSCSLANSACFLRKVFNLDLSDL